MTKSPKRPKDTVSLGRRGGLKGGTARAKALSPDHIWTLGEIAALVPEPVAKPRGPYKPRAIST